MTSRRIFGLLFLAGATLSCSSESLTIQQQFPFTVSSESLPSAIRAGVPVSFQLGLTPERLTTHSQYRLRWRTLSERQGELAVDKKGLLPGQFTTLESLTPTLTFMGKDAATYKFSLVITDESGVSKELPFEATVL